jgi:tRNA (guanine-N7-)-methyltransferase
MPKKKLQRFAEMATLENVVQPRMTFPPSDHELKGKWNQDFFGNAHPIVLELGCGKGEYTVGLAEQSRHMNFIGVDIKGARMWRGSKSALEQRLNNAAFLRVQIDHLLHFFGMGEVYEIWITFPDPQPQKSREKKRLTSMRFIEKYKTILVPGGIIHLKTDDKPLYEYTLGVIAENKLKLLDAADNLYGDEAPERLPARSIQTFYEKMFLEEGKKICYLKFTV